MTEPIFNLAARRVWVAGHQGMVGSALVRRLANEDCQVLTVSRAALDLTRQREVEDWVASNRPEVVVVAAAKVGGIRANDQSPVDFLHDNLVIEANVLSAAQQSGVKKLLLLGSSCIYPKLSPQPIPEDALLTGPLEPTNQWYAIAKIAGIKLCQAYRRQYGCDFISAMPCNLFGPGDSFDLETSHVIPALIRKIHEAKMSGTESVEVWGSGTPRREFLFVDDLADALVYILRFYSAAEHINVGSGQDLPVRDLADLISQVIDYKGSFSFDRSKPDGAPRKVLDVSRLNELGWTSKTDLRDGLAQTYEWYVRKSGEGSRDSSESSATRRSLLSGAEQV